jgi:hypothetical protein
MIWVQVQYNGEYAVHISGENESNAPIYFKSRKEAWDFVDSLEVESKSGGKETLPNNSVRDYLSDL